MKLFIYSGATRQKHLAQYAVVAVTLFMVTLRKPPTASEELHKVINTNEPVVGGQKFVKVTPTSAQNLLLGFSQEQPEQGHLCRSNSRMDGCTPEQRQAWASPPHSLGTTGAGMSFSRAPGPGVPRGPCGIVRALTMTQVFSLAFIMLI